ncbi:MAG: thermonuclease family protein [Rhodobacteraceae bacterium]|jgi:micrococcal nuclease|nr:thermonuclease family protein [Paracoccaceae bacterium]MBL4559288.1 thermonuclease family protein [Paracoccaceae bacterium]HBG99340.1 nuclease [Paracoccaceae bacterium]
MIAALALVLLEAATPVAGYALDGRVTAVRDVDTIEVAGVPVRLNGVDGPETGTRAGDAAAHDMRQLVQGRQVRCSLNGERSHDRRIGVCSLDGMDIGALAIMAGHALDCPRCSGGRYRPLERLDARTRLPRAGCCQP